MSGFDLRQSIARLGYATPEPLPEWLEGPVQAVLVDLQGERPVEIGLSYAAAPIEDWGAVLVVEAGYERSGSSFGVEKTKRGAELLFQIADGFQEQVFPELHGSWGEARPECPGHPHPAEPEIIDGEAWWICPRDERPIKLIGS
jgi:hypothetical protein